MITISEIRKLYGLDRSDDPADSDGQVTGLIIIDSLERCDLIRPGQAVIIASGVAFDAGWDLDIAVRIAWEHAAACVILDASVTTAPAQRVGQQLGIPVVLAEQHPFDIALQLAQRLSQHGSEGDTLLRATDALASKPHTPRSACEALHALFPRISFVLRDAGGRCLASTDPQLSDAPVLTSAPDSASGDAVSAVIPGPQPDSDWTLAALTQQSSLSPAIDRTVILAALSLSAWRFQAELSETISAETSRELFGLVTNHSNPGTALRTELRAAGWPPGPTLSIAVALSQRNGGWAGMLSQLRIAFSPAAVIPMQGSALMLFHPQDDPMTRAPQGIAILGDEVAGVGVVTEVESYVDIREAFEHARFAASLAQHVSSRMLHYEALQPDSFLQFAASTQLVEHAQDLLQPLLRLEQRHALLETLLTVLDCGDRYSMAAKRLGLHRNTIASRMDRIVDAGIDVTNPQKRLMLHLAARLTTRELAEAPSTPSN